MYIYNIGNIWLVEIVLYFGLEWLLNYLTKKTRSIPYNSDKYMLDNPKGQSRMDNIGYTSRKQSKQNIPYNSDK